MPSRGRLCHTMMGAAELSDFTRTITLYGREMRARNTRVVYHADLHRIGGEARELAVFPGLHIAATDAEPGVNAQGALLPGGIVHDLGADSHLLDLVVKLERHQLADRAGRVHLAHIAER